MDLLNSYPVILTKILDNFRLGNDGSAWRRRGWTPCAALSHRASF